MDNSAVTNLLEDDMVLVVPRGHRLAGQARTSCVDRIHFRHVTVLRQHDRARTAAGSLAGCVFQEVEFPVRCRRVAQPGAKRVDDRETLLSAYDEAAAIMTPELLMVQELIPGSGEAQYSYTALARDGQPLVHLTAKRRRQYPIDFGRASTYVETVNEPGVMMAHLASCARTPGPAVQAIRAEHVAFTPPLLEPRLTGSLTSNGARCTLATRRTRPTLRSGSTKTPRASLTSSMA
jgi:hypothetical protein